MAIIQLTSELYRTYVMEGKAPILVEYFAPWCTYCQRIAPVYRKLAEDREGALVMAQVDIDASPAIADREQIEVVPTFVLYSKGKAVGSIVAPESREQLEAFLADTPLA